MSRCTRARELFGPYWDDETTRAEREWLDAHFASCDRCRTEYDALARTLGTMAALPRAEASPDLAERALAAARRRAPAADRFPERARPQWIPVAAAAGLLLAIGAALPLVLPRLQPGATLAHLRTPVAEPRLVAAAPPRAGAPVTHRGATHGESVAAAVAESLFDHSEDVDFVLDPVTLHRGRARTSTPRSTPTVQGDQAVITF